MTVIAAFTVDGRYPYLLSDLLISGPEGRQPASIPSVGDVSLVFPAGSGFVPIGLMQKLVLMGPDLAIAWAGTIFAARSALRRFVELRAEHTGTLEALCDRFFLGVLPNEYDKENVSLIAYVISKGAQPGKQYISAYTFHAAQQVDLSSPGSASLVKILMAGSGAPFVYNFMHGLRVTGPAGVSQTDSLSVALGIGGQILAHEIVAHAKNNLAAESNLLHYFGGGFEAACFTPERGFFKLSDYTSVFWVITIANGRIQISHDQVGFNFSHYEGDVLVLRTGMFRRQKVPHAEQGVRFAPPVTRPITPGEQWALSRMFGPASWGNRLSLNAQNVMHLVSLWVANEYKATFSLGPDLGGISFAEGETSTEFEIEQGLLDRLLRSARRTYDALPHAIEPEAERPPDGGSKT